MVSRLVHGARSSSVGRRPSHCVACQPPRARYAAQQQPEASHRRRLGLRSTCSMPRPAPASTVPVGTWTDRARCTVSPIAAAAACSEHDRQFAVTAPPTACVLGITPFRFPRRPRRSPLPAAARARPAALGFRARAGRSDRMRRLQLAHDVCGNGPWPMVSTAPTVAIRLLCARCLASADAARGVSASAAWHVPARRSAGASARPCRPR